MGSEHDQLGRKMVSSTFQLRQRFAAIPVANREISLDCRGMFLDLTVFLAPCAI